MSAKLSWPYANAVEPAVYSGDYNWPKISIITPSYNQGAFIEETILSVLNQNYPNLEYLVIDGGSSDGTVDILKKYGSRLDYWISEPDRGQSHALNKGLGIATGEIVGYLNSDDCLLKEALHVVAGTFNDFRKKSGRPVILSGHALLGNTIAGSKDIFFSQHGDWSLSGVAAGYGICPQPSTFWTKSNVLFDEQLKFCMDFDYWVRLVRADYQYVNIDSSLSFYRIHDSAKGSTMTDIMWLELAGLSFMHAGLTEDVEERSAILRSYKYKLRNYFLTVLKKADGPRGRAALLKKIAGIVLSHPGLCLNAGFLRAALALLLRG